VALWNTRNKRVPKPTACRHRGAKGENIMEVKRYDGTESWEEFNTREEMFKRAKEVAKDPGVKTIILHLAIPGRRNKKARKERT